MRNLQAFLMAEEDKTPTNNGSYGAEDITVLEGLVDRVVDDLVDQVVEARRTRGTDVHPGPLAHGLQALENRDVLGRVRHAFTLSASSGGTLVSVLPTPRSGTRKAW